MYASGASGSPIRYRRSTNRSASQRTSSSGDSAASNPLVEIPACGTLTTTGLAGSCGSRAMNAPTAVSNIDMARFYHVSL